MPIPPCRERQQDRDKVVARLRQDVLEPLALRRLSVRALLEQTLIGQVA